MSQQELVSTLRECPESPLFGQENIFMEESHARQLVIQFVNRAIYSAQPLVNLLEEDLAVSPKFGANDADEMQIP